MNLSDELEHYLEEELHHCQSCYAICQELDWLLKSEMTDLEQRELELLSTLERLHETRRFFQQPEVYYHLTPNGHYTPEHDFMQEDSLCLESPSDTS